MKPITFVLLISIMCVLTSGKELSKGSPDPTQSFKIASSYFIPNTVNQKTQKKIIEDDHVCAFIHTQKGRVMFTSSGAFIGISIPDRQANKSVININRDDVFDFQNHSSKTIVLKSGFSTNQANKRKIVPRLEEMTSATVNFLRGPKNTWRRNLPTYKKLVYPEVWDGIDVEFIGYLDRLEFQVQLQPGSDPNEIHMNTGSENLQILEDGRLKITSFGAEMILSKPFAYQLIEEQKIEVSVQYQLKTGDSFGFKLGPYNSSYALNIDPILRWSSFLGGSRGSGSDRFYGFDVDVEGNTYLTGYTTAPDFPTTPGAFDTVWNGGGRDALAMKLNATGSEIVYSTFIGGSNQETGIDIKVDSSGNAYIFGSTNSIGFPTTNGAYDETHNNGYDTFILKLNPDGNSLIYSTFLGGNGSDYASSIDLDSNGNVYVAGETKSYDFPITPGAHDDSFNEGNDVFFSKLSADGSMLFYSSYLGGTWDEFVHENTVDSSGYAYLVGYTYSIDFPTTGGSFQGSPNSVDGTSTLDGFVTKIAQDGSSLVFSTYLGGFGSDYGRGICVNSVGEVYVTGETSSTGFPTTVGALDEEYNGQRDAFLTNLSVDGSTVIYSTFLGGPEYDGGNDVLLDSEGQVIIFGETRSTSFPTSIGSFDETHNGSGDIFVTKLNPIGDALVFSTLLGGAEGDYGIGIHLDSSGNPIVSGSTLSSNFPVTNGVYDETHNQDQDMFVTKLDSTGSLLTYSTFLSGILGDVGHDISVDISGNTFITGKTYSSQFPTTTGAFNGTHGGDWDAFVVKMDTANGDLIYSTYLGGSDMDTGKAIEVDSLGNAFVVGDTYSNDYPTTAGAFNESRNGYTDVFLTKLNPNGSELSFSTYFGGRFQDVATGLAIGDSGNVFVLGNTRNGYNFPTTPGAYDEVHNGDWDVFVTKFNSQGSDLLYSTFLGSNREDLGNGIAVDNDGNAYISGATYSTGFPTTTGAYDQSYGGLGDAFVSQLNPDGSTLTYSTFLGGSELDIANGIVLSSFGEAVITGQTNSTGFPATIGSLDETYNGSTDAFLSKLNSSGNGLVYSTLLGGSEFDSGNGVVLDLSGNACLIGQTYSQNFPITGSAFDTMQNGRSDVFIGCISSLGSDLIYSTYLGGADWDNGHSIDLDFKDNFYVTGYTTSIDFPVTSGAFDETLDGHGDAFVFKLNYFYDYNQDGCSNFNDFLELLPIWTKIIDENHRVSILDFLMINMDGPIPCP